MASAGRGSGGAGASLGGAGILRAEEVPVVVPGNPAAAEVNIPVAARRTKVKYENFKGRSKEDG